MIDDHTCTPETCPEGGRYFVTAIDGPSWFPMSGPYTTHQAALADVDRALKIANEHDGRAWFMRWGTARLPDDSKITTGSLNKAGLLVIHEHSVACTNWRMLVQASIGKSLKSKS
jgi:hypothetical protein